MTDLEADILSAHLGRDNIPLTVEVLGVSDPVVELSKRVAKLETQTDMNSQSISSIDGVLVGRDGKGGAIERLEKGQAAMASMIEGIRNLFVKDVGDLKSLVDANTHNIQALTEAQKTTEEKVCTHLREVAQEDKAIKYRKGARQWDLMKSIVLLAAGALLTLALFFGFGIG